MTKLKNGTLDLFGFVNRFGYFDKYVLDELLTFIERIRIETSYVTDVAERKQRIGHEYSEETSMLVLMLEYDVWQMSW